MPLSNLSRSKNPSWKRATVTTIGWYINETTNRLLDETQYSQRGQVPGLWTHSYSPRYKTRAYEGLMPLLYAVEIQIGEKRLRDPYEEVPRIRTEDRRGRPIYTVRPGCPIIGINEGEKEDVQILLPPCILGRVDVIHMAPSHIVLLPNPEHLSRSIDTSGFWLDGPSDDWTFLHNLFHSRNL